MWRGSLFHNVGALTVNARQPYRVGGGCRGQAHKWEVAEDCRLSLNLFIFVYTHIHWCVYVLYTLYFPEFCEKKNHRHFTRCEIRTNDLCNSRKLSFHPGILWPQKHNRFKSLNFRPNTVCHFVESKIWLSKVACHVIHRIHGVKGKPHNFEVCLSSSCRSLFGAK